MPLTDLYRLITQAETHWLGQTASKRRQYFVCALAKYYTGSNRAKAKLMFTHLTRYWLARWQYDKDKLIVPDKYRNTKSELLFRLLKENNGSFLKEETIRQILNGVGEVRVANSPTLHAPMIMEKSFDSGSCISYRELSG